MNIPAKVDYMTDSDFIINGKVEPKYYKDELDDKKNRQYKPRGKKAITPIQSESVMTPTGKPYRQKQNNTDLVTISDTSTGDANIMLNEIAKLFNGSIDEMDNDISIKIRNNDNETKWLNVGYDVIYTLSDIIKQLIK